MKMSPLFEWAHFLFFTFFFDSSNFPTERRQGNCSMSYPVLVVQMVNVVYQPDYHLAVEVFATVEELPFHMLETGKPEEPFPGTLVCPVAV